MPKYTVEIEILLKLSADGPHRGTIQAPLELKSEVKLPAETFGDLGAILSSFQTWAENIRRAIEDDAIRRNSAYTTNEAATGSPSSKLVPRK